MSNNYNISQKLRNEKDICIHDLQNNCREEKCCYNHLSNDNINNILKRFIKDPTKVSNFENKDNISLKIKKQLVQFKNYKPFITSCLYCLLGLKCRNYENNRFFKLPIKFNKKSLNYVICFNINEKYNKIMLYIHLDMNIINKNKNYIEINNILPLEYKVICEDNTKLNNFNIENTNFPVLNTIKNKQPNNIKQSSKSKEPVKSKKPVKSKEPYKIKQQVNTINNNLIKDKTIMYLLSVIKDTNNKNNRKILNNNIIINELIIKNKYLNDKLNKMDEQLNNKNNVLLKMIDTKEDYYVKNRDNINYMSFMETFNY